MLSHPRLGSLAAGFFGAALTLVACGESAPPPVVALPPPASAGPGPTAAPGGGSRPVTPKKAADSDAFGGIALDTEEPVVLKILGPPATREAPQVEGASGLLLGAWTWPDKGVRLVMDTTAKGKSATVHAIHLKAPCTLKDPQGVGIGSKRADVVTVFGPRVASDPRAPKDSSRIVVDSIFGGLIFSLKNDLVESVFVGAAAE